MRAIWKGYLKCSRVTIPIKMFTAVTKRPLQFHRYHKASGSRIHKENVWAVCGQTRGPEEIETPWGHFVAPALKRLIE
ncbi:MAG: hypothetical protein ACOZFS_15745 [Thermodesulfobacteriota bacterium]